jgi:hypothetical protein
MPSMTPIKLFTRALSLILAVFCIPPTLTALGSCKPYIAQRAEDHSPAYKKGLLNILNKPPPTSRMIYGPSTTSVCAFSISSDSMKRRTPTSKQ